MNDTSWPENLMEANWLEANLNAPRLRILDATWFLPKTERSGVDEFVSEHIPGALHFDYDQNFHDPNSSFPRTLPKPDDFEDGLQKLGLNQNDRVVVYDNNDLFSSPRAWWMLKSIGVKKVSVLNGGLKAWKQMGGPLESGQGNPWPPGDFQASFSNDFFIGADKVLSVLDQPSVRLLDARSKERFDIAHMPGADNLPYTDIVKDGFIRDIDDLAEYFDDRPMICTCGSGVTACILALGATLSGQQQISVYDASWSQWGNDPSLPKEGTDPDQAP